MKWLPLSLCLLWPLATLADDAVKPLHPAQPNVEIINGKKFFSLNNARRFTGSTNDPKALSVLHHPHTEGSPSLRHPTPLPLSSTRTRPAAAGATTVSAPDNVLSIFAPDDKSLPAAGK